MGLNAARSVAALGAGMFNVRGDSSRFILVLDNSDYDLGAWSRVSGLGVSWEPVEYRSGAHMETWSAPGNPKYTKISLSRAVCVDSMNVQKWLEEAQNERKPFSGVIVLLSPVMAPLTWWTLRSLYPVSWRVADLDAKAATVLIETLELTHGGFLELGAVGRNMT